MPYFEIFYRGTDSTEHSKYIKAEDRETAIHFFRLRYTNAIIRVDNKSLNEIHYQVSSHFIAFLKNSSNKNERMIGMLNKPIAAIATMLEDEIQHYLHHEEHHDAFSIAKQIFLRSF